MWNKSITDAIKKISVFNIKKGRLFSTIQNVLESNYVPYIEQAGLSDLEFKITSEAMNAVDDILRSSDRIHDEGIFFPYVKAERDEVKYTISVDLFDDTIGFSIIRCDKDGTETVYDIDSDTWMLLDECDDEEDIPEDGGLSALLELAKDENGSLSKFTEILKNASDAKYQSFYLDSLNKAETLFKESIIADKDNPYGYIPKSDIEEYVNKFAAIWTQNDDGNNSASYSLIPVWLCIQFGEYYHRGLRTKLTDCQTTEEYLDALSSIMMNIISNTADKDPDYSKMTFILMHYSHDYAKLCIDEGIRLCGTLYLHIIEDSGTRSTHS